MVSSETLQRFPLFAGLEPAFLADLSSLSEERTAQKDEWLFHEGDSADALYLIVQGSVDLKLKLDEKRNIYGTLSTLSDGNALGWSAIVEPYIYSMGAIASDQTQVLRFESKDLRALLEKSPDQGYILMRNIAQTMATRVNLLSERAPRLSWRLLVSTGFYIVGIATGALVLVAGVSLLFIALSGSSRATQVLPEVLFCLIFPAVLLILASIIYPARSRGNLTLH